MRTTCAVIAMALAMSLCATIGVAQQVVTQKPVIDREQLQGQAKMVWIQDLNLSDEQEAQIAAIRKEYRPKIEESAKVDASLAGPDEQCAVKLYTDAMRSAVAGSALLEHLTVQHTAVAAEAGAKPVEGIEHLARCSRELATLRPHHRRATLDSVASGRLTASEAFANVDAVRLLDQQAHHAWRAAAYLAGVVT